MALSDLPTLADGEKDGCGPSAREDVMTDPTKPAHTPGPWTSAESPMSFNGNLWFVSTDGPYGKVAETTNAADARLIAAAPELLAALKRIIDGEGVDELWLAENPGAVDTAHAAIMKAEGT